MRWIVATEAALGAALVLMVAACGDDGPPDYPNVHAIARALNDGGIDCVLEDTTLSEPSSARSTGRCDGDGFRLQLVVYRTSEAREEAERDIVELACELGVENPKVVRGDRWSVGDVEPTLGPTALYADDIAEATDGDLIPICD